VTGFVRNGQSDARLRRAVLRRLERHPGAWIWSGMLAPSRTAVSSILLSALFGVALALPVLRTSRGKQALLIGSINSAIWVIFAIDRQRRREGSNPHACF
jgi:hypothetical protein